jgi:uncharacterized protein YraI
MQIESVSTNTPNFITATLPPTFVQLSTQTSIPLSAPTSVVPTNQPVEGTTTTEVNVRAETNTASQSLGVIAAFSKIQIIGKESSGNWFKVIYNESVGWVRAEFVQVDSSVEVSVVEIESGSRSGRSGVVISGINVRSGAGISYESIGVLTPKDVVSIIAKDASGAWMQIIFGNDAGWVAAEFLQIENVESIPVVEATQSTPVASETQVIASQVAASDGDSIELPLLKTTLEENRALQITGEVSAPQGDNEDWVEFSSAAEKIVIEISCSDNSLQLELWQVGSILEQFATPCNQLFLLNVSVNESYTLRVFQPITNENKYTNYRLNVKVFD